MYKRAIDIKAYIVTRLLRLKSMQDINKLI